MNYCLFESGDIVGPFPVEQLLKREGFSAKSLVCPEEHSEDESYWKEAAHYADFGFSSSREEQVEVVSANMAKDKAEHFLREMEKTSHDLLSLDELTQRVPTLPPNADKEMTSEGLAEQTAAVTWGQAAPGKSLPVADAEPTKQPLPVAPSEATQPGAVELPSGKTASTPPKISDLLMRASKEMRQTQPGREPTVPPLASAEKTQPESEGVSHTVVSGRTPIEEYFNTMQSGDLGNILGIPDPKANSDLNLARVLEKQFERTDPGIPSTSLRDDDPFDAFATDYKTESIDESLFSAAASEAIDKKTEEKLTQSLPSAKVAHAADNQSAIPMIDQTDPIRTVLDKKSTMTDPRAVAPQPNTDTEDKTVQTILEGKLEINAKYPELQEPIKQAMTQVTIPQEDDEKGFPEPFLYHLFKNGTWLKIVLFFLLLAGFGTVGIYLYKSNHIQLAAGKHPVPTQTTTPSAVNSQPAQAAIPAGQMGAIKAAPMVEEVPTTTTVLGALAANNLEEQAKNVVRNYVLDKERGTIENYLKTRYTKELASGYSSTWAAEPLHRQIYVVKYRLAKTRQEPIVYIFQVDPSKKKLTGALNNITLDLVGKIN